jgi:hypothetical protein
MAFYRVGKKLNYNGNKVIITAVNPDGTATINHAPGSLKTGFAGTLPSLTNASTFPSFDAAREPSKASRGVSPNVTLIDGSSKQIEFPDSILVCLLCGTEYVASVYGLPSYCDETIDCAFDDGEHLVHIDRS